MALLMFILCIGIICACSGIIKYYVDQVESFEELDPVDIGAILFFGSIITFCALVAVVLIKIGIYG